MIYVYLSTVKWDLISASIRWGTGADWSHVGFYDSSTGKTFSAMHDKIGVGWRDLDPKAKILLLEIPRADLPSTRRVYRPQSRCAVSTGWSWSRCRPRSR